MAVNADSAIYRCIPIPHISPLFQALGMPTSPNMFSAESPFHLHKRPFGNFATHPYHIDGSYLPYTVFEGAILIAFATSFLLTTSTTRSPLYMLQPTFTVGTKSGLQLHFDLVRSGSDLASSTQRIPRSRALYPLVETCTFRYNPVNARCLFLH